MMRIHGNYLAGAIILIAAAAFFSREIRMDPASKHAAAVGSTSPPARDSRLAKPEISKASHRPAGTGLKGLRDLARPELSPHPAGSPAEQEWVAGRVKTLEDLEWFDDPESLAKILAELRNPLPEIREAALAATKAFGSRDAVPYLKVIKAETRDPVEQKSLAELIAFLSLPTMTEQFQGDLTE
jgi:hypothetical protein